MIRGRDISSSSLPIVYIVFDDISTTLQLNCDYDSSVMSCANMTELLSRDNEK